MSVQTTFDRIKKEGFRNTLSLSDRSQGSAPLVLKTKFAMETMDKVTSKETIMKKIYMKILKTFLMTTGSWPGEGMGEYVSPFLKCLRIYIPIQTTIGLIGQSLYIFQFHSQMEFFDLGNCYLTAFFGFITIVRSALTSFKSYERIVKTFVCTFHLGHHKHKGEYIKEIYNTVEKISRGFAYFAVVQMFTGVTFYNVIPNLENYKNGAFNSANRENATLEYAILITYPGFEMKDHFYFTVFFDFYLTYNCSIVLCYIDLFLYVMIFQIIGHIKVLRDNLNKLPLPAKRNFVTMNNDMGQEPLSIEMYDAEENLMIHDKLVEWIDYHRMIVSFTEELSTCFGPILGLNYTFHVCGCCLLLLELSVGEADVLVRFVPLSVIIFGQLIMISVTFEIVGTESEKLKDAVYNIPWEFMNTRNRRTVCILLNRLQKPINVTAMELTTVGVTTMASILKTTLSYFAILQSMNQD